MLLSRDVPNLGRRGAVVEVADGHARNYLLPRGLAMPASEGLVQDMAEREKANLAKEKRMAEQARELASSLNGQEIVIEVRTGGGGKLFGAVTNKEIAESIRTKYGVQIDRRKIDLPVPIKATGSYEVVVHLHPQVTATITVTVTGASERS